MNRKNIFKLLGVFAITGMILLACMKNDSRPPTYPGGQGDTTTTTTNKPSMVTMYNMAFTPNTVTVDKGTVVTWKNDDSYAHTVTSNDGGATFSSGNVGGGGTFSYTTNTVGTFNYHCLIHGIPMSGVLVVK